MSLFISSVFTYDEDAGNYIQAVETADAQALEPATRKAINDFVIGCKQDGIWTAIKASCILAGARTRLGALTPLVGTAPTPFGFVDANYDRKTGLVGDGSTKYLDSSRACDADGQNNVHVSLWHTTRETNTSRYLGGALGGVTLELMGFSTGFGVRCQSSSLFFIGSSSGSLPGFIGVSRSSSEGFTWRDNKSGGTQLNTSTGVSAGNYFIYRSNSTTSASTNERLAFYSIGESLDLALLDARVTDLINAFAVTIP
jgi:hypothetical protein